MSHCMPVPAVSICMVLLLNLSMELWGNFEEDLESVSYFRVRSCIVGVLGLTRSCFDGLSALIVLMFGGCFLEILRYFAPFLFVNLYAMYRL